MTSYDADGGIESLGIKPALESDKEEEEEEEEEDEDEEREEEDEDDADSGDGGPPPLPRTFAILQEKLTPKPQTSNAAEESVTGSSTISNERDAADTSDTFVRTRERPRGERWSRFTAVLLEAPSDREPCSGKATTSEEGES